MTTKNEARTALYGRVTGTWAPAVGFNVSRQITFQNDEFRPPRAEPWVRVSLLDSLRTQETLNAPGEREFESQARLMAQIFVPAETGTSESDNLVSEFRNAFEGTQFPGLDMQIFGVESTDIGRREELDQTNVEVLLTYREKH